MSKVGSRNAPVAALIYEFLYDAYRMMERDRSLVEEISESIDVPLGVFFHGFLSKREWSADILVKVGAIVPVMSPLFEEKGIHIQNSVTSSPYYTPVMTLQACRESDFSAFETFDFYCMSMYVFELHVGSYDDVEGQSPRFLEDVATKDDVFDIGASSRVTFNKVRFEEKVMTRWRESNLPLLLLP